jgi:hypothetical protein
VVSFQTAFGFKGRPHTGGGLGPALLLPHPSTDYSCLNLTVRLLSVSSVASALHLPAVPL